MISKLIWNLQITFLDFLFILLLLLIWPVDLYWTNQTNQTFWKLEPEGPALKCHYLSLRSDNSNINLNAAFLSILSRQKCDIFVIISISTCASRTHNLEGVSKYFSMQEDGLLKIEEVGNFFFLFLCSYNRHQTRI